MKLEQTVREKEQARSCTAATWRRGLSGGSGGSGGMTGERVSSGAFKHDDGGGSGGGLRHDGEVITIIAMEKSRTASERGGKNGMAVAGEIHRRRLSWDAGVREFLSSISEFRN